MVMLRPFDFDVASALSKGQRRYQEDAIIVDFARGAHTGIAVLSDGMGGHAAGDVASKIVVTEVFSELTLQRNETEAFEANITTILHDAAIAANECLRDHVQAYPETRGMGATLVATVVINRNLYWISIGDSPLFLFRKGVLTQLNEDHSMAPQIDFMARSGLIAAEEAACHPDRNTLTSVLFGDHIPKIDCPDEPVVLEDGDMLIVASDGLQFLTDEQLTSLLRKNRERISAEIADTLLEHLVKLEDPDLDNATFSVVKFEKSESEGLQNAAPRPPGDIRCVG
jgi:protein phosphatase